MLTDTLIHCQERQQLRVLFRVADNHQRFIEFFFLNDNAATPSEMDAGYKTSLFIKVETVITRACAFQPDRPLHHCGHTISNQR